MGQNGYSLLHHVDIVHALRTRPGIPYVFQVAVHILLPVHIVRLHAHAGGLLGPQTHHGFRRFSVGKRILFQTLLQTAAALDGQRMHGQIFRPHFPDLS